MTLLLLFTSEVTIYHEAVLRGAGKTVLEEGPMTEKPNEELAGGWQEDVAGLRAARPSGILFLCVANSARSQMAEGIARSLAPTGVALFSAGSVPSSVHPLAVQALEEIGIDISSHSSKGTEAIPADAVDAVITLCAEEICPVWLSGALRLHWGLPDPAAAGGAKALAEFRLVRDELVQRLRLLFE